MFKFLLGLLGIKIPPQFEQEVGIIADILNVVSEVTDDGQLTLTDIDPIVAQVYPRLSFGLTTKVSKEELQTAIKAVILTITQVSAIVQKVK